MPKCLYYFLVRLKVELSHSKKIYFIYFSESLLKMIKNAFYFILNALVVLKIIIFWFDLLVV